MIKNNFLKKGLALILACSLASFSPSLISSNALSTEDTLGPIQNVQTTPEEYVEGEAIVIFQNIETSNGTLSSSKSAYGIDDNISIDTMLTTSKLPDIKPDTINQKGKTLSSTSNQCIIAKVSSDTYSTKELIKKLNTSKKVYSAEPNYIYHALGITNDPLVDEQWYLKNTGMGSSNNPSSDIHYDSVKNETKSSQPVVAIVDTGMDFTNPDLANKAYTRYTYNAFSTNKDATDDNSHGTHVAGVIGAESNNSTGIAGISTAKLLPVKCLDKTGSGSSMNLIQGLNYIIEQMQKGVKIKAINMSLGGFRSASVTVSVVNSLIKKAGTLGAVTVFASGNDGANIDKNALYPACFNNPYIISVGASTDVDEVATFSNRGQYNVDVMAPGTSILSTFTQTHALTSTAGVTSYLPSYDATAAHDTYYNQFESQSNLPASSNLITTCSEAKQSIALTNSQYYGPKKNGNGHSLVWTVTLSKAASGRCYLSLPCASAKKSSYTNLKVKTSANASGAGVYLFSTGSQGSDDGIPVGGCNYWSDLTGNFTAGNNSIRLVLASPTGTLKAGTYKIYIDDFGINTTTTRYATEQGTSMAAPVVSGEVALLSSIRPSYSSIELRNRIIGGIDQKSSIGNTCATGGRVNIQKALNAPAPVIHSVTTNYTTIYLHGSNFTGAGTPTVKIGGTQVKIAKITNNLITIDGSKLSSGIKGIYIANSRGHYYISSNLSITKKVSAKSLKLTASQTALSPGQKLKLKAVISPSNVSVKTIKYTSSNPKYLTVSSNGTMQAKSAGLHKTVTVTASTTDGTNIKRSIKIKIQRLVTKIKLNKKSAKWSYRKTFKLKASVTPKNADNKKVSWKVSNKKYAKVSSKGKVKFKKAAIGKKVTITATAKDPGHKTKKIKIKVTK